MWTFGKKIAISFFIVFLLLVGIGAVAYRSTTALTNTSYAVTHANLVMEHISNIFSLLKDAETGQRGFVITGDETYLEPYNLALDPIAHQLKDLREITAADPVQQQRLDEIEPLVALKLGELKRTVETRRSAGFEPTLKIISGGIGKKAMDDIRLVFEKMQRDQQEQLRKRAQEVESSAATSQSAILWGTAVCLVVVSLLGITLSNSLSSQIGLAVQHVQSSSAELQAAANQQVTGARESSTSMHEIATTISELLATSRQISESSQRVAAISEQTAGAARAGDGTVLKASDSIAGIRRQMDLVVSHMLDLGKKSQQIGSILDIVSEMAEQTNILAINATIEAAGAGEAGKRFAVVADEIRKLSDRVTLSTKEVRGLIEDVRSAVNTTVMATETGSKAVDAGSRQFSDVASSFKQIAQLVLTSTEAAREIELSTKQQTTAVEQVNLAISNVAQATKETEASSGQTLQTASELAALSKDLLRIVKPST